MMHGLARYPFIFPLVETIVGVVLLFFGYRLFKSVISIAGFLLGAWLGSHFAITMEIVGLLRIIIVVVSGLILCALFHFVYKLGLFIAGAVAGFIFSGMILEFAMVPSSPILLFIGAIILGISTVILQKFLIVLSTSMVGSVIILYGINSIFKWFPLPPLFDRFINPIPHPPDMISTLLWLILTALGIFFQLRVKGS